MRDQEQNAGIASRVAVLIEYKTGGNRARFAAQAGWSKQRMNKVLRGEAIGLTCIDAILRAYPDVNARWLITGNGRMLDMGSVVLSLLELEDYIPVMTEAERCRIMSGGTWRPEDLAAWQTRLNEKRGRVHGRIAESMRRHELKGRKLQETCNPDNGGNANN